MSRREGLYKANPSLQAKERFSYFVGLSLEPRVIRCVRLTDGIAVDMIDDGGGVTPRGEMVPNQRRRQLIATLSKRTADGNVLMVPVEPIEPAYPGDPIASVPSFNDNEDSLRPLISKNVDKRNKKSSQAKQKMLAEAVASVGKKIEHIDLDSDVKEHKAFFDQDDDEEDEDDD